MKRIVTSLFQLLDERLRKTVVDEHGPILETLRGSWPRVALNKALSQKRGVSSMHGATCRVGFPGKAPNMYSNVDPRDAAAFRITDCFW
jgi:hypothetical protein